MSHFEEGEIPVEYNSYIQKKLYFLLTLLIIVLLVLAAGISLGAVDISPAEIIRTLVNLELDTRVGRIIYSIRLPRAAAALLAGAGLAIAGGVMQSVLRNPLGSPFTLGISQAAAFGAAFAVMILGAGEMQSGTGGGFSVLNPYLTVIFAFASSVFTAIVILFVARLRGATPEVMVLSGVALGSLFSAGTLFLQYFADDTQLAAMVFWTFGDVGRAGFREVAVMLPVVSAGSAFFIYNSWNYNALDTGDETARGLGVNVRRVRLVGMLVATAITATVISFLGIIGFVGLICPHMIRRIIGDDHRYLLPATFLAGAVLLLVSDIVARLLLSPRVLPVAILTSFLGAPVFFYLLFEGNRR